MDDVSEPMFFAIDSEWVAKANPFGDNECSLVEITREVNVSQLTDEISERVRCQVQLSLVNARPGEPIEPGNPARLYVTPVVAEEVLTQAIKDHVVDDLYGMPPGQRERARLAAKLGAGEELTAAEMNQALRLILA